MAGTDTLRLWGAAVFMNGEELRMREEETKQERVMGADDGSELQLAWNLHYPELGNAVEIVTGAPPVMKDPIYVPKLGLPA